VLSPSHRRTLRAFAERLVPTDEHGPGAVDAGALGYVEQALAGDYAALLPAYVAGLEALDATTIARDGRAFADLDPETQDARLREVEGRAFFELVRRHVMEGMFGDPVHGGNRDHAGWQLLGYRGPQREWTAEEQRIREADA
jgi:hypothetical protein